MQKRLYVIGNGFDLFHGLKTGYWNFKEYLKKNDKELLKILEEYFPEDYLWSDFEGTLEYLDGERISDNCANYLMDYSSEDWSESGHHDYQYAVSEIIGQLTHNLKVKFREWVSAISPNDAEVDSRAKIAKESKFLSFNYTNTLEVLYRVELDNILYIHGRVKTPDQTLILGHGRNPKEIEQISSDDDEDTDVRVAEANQSIDGYYATNYKNTEEILTDNQDFFESLSDIEEIFVLGHSMSQVDERYFQEIVEKVDLNAVGWTVSYHNENEIAEKTDFLNFLGIPTDKVSFKKIKEIDSSQIGLF